MTICASGIRGLVIRSPLSRPPQSLTVVLPLPPNRANPRQGSTAKVTGFLKRDYLEGTAKKLGAVAMIRGQMRRWVAPPCAVVSARFYVWNLMDETDNLPARLKWPLDALVRAGALAGDDPAHCKRGTIEQYVSRERMRVEVTLTPLGET